jgi:hypothetical protein
LNLTNIPDVTGWDAPQTAILQTVPFMIFC